VVWLPFTTGSQETEWVYSQNPGAHTKHDDTERDLIAVAGENNRNHAPLWVIIDNFTEVDSAADLVSCVALWTKRTTMSVRLEQSTRANQPINRRVLDTGNSTAKNRRPKACGEGCTERPRAHGTRRTLHAPPPI